MLKVALLGSAWVLYLLMALSVVSLAAMVERWVFFRRHRDDTEKLRADIAKALLAGDADKARARLAESPSLEARVLREALPWWKGGADAFNDAVDSELRRVQKEIERGTSLLGTLGNNAPFIGLLGTVIGVIEAFREFGAGASKAAMGNVMGGIAEALIATGVGLFVALPAVVAFNLLQKRISEVEASTHAVAKLFTAYLKTTRDTAAPGLSLAK
jgi:biopolymer transport protein ExbB/biopolymer transport protein TolQ